MKVIRVEPIGSTPYGSVVETFSAQFCEDAGWTVPDMEGKTDSLGNTFHVLPNEADVSIGDRFRDGRIVREDTKALDDVKFDQLTAISAGYRNYDASGVAMTSKGFPIQVGQDHVTKLDGAIRFAELMGASEIYITDANDVTHDGISLKDAQAILAEIMGAALQAHALKQKLRAQINAAETVEDVRAVIWPF